MSKDIEITKEMKETLIGQGVDAAYKYLSKVGIDDISKHVFHIDNWSIESQLFFYISLVGYTLFFLTLFPFVNYLIAWIGVFISILLIGFIFTKNGKRYNLSFVLISLFLIMLIASNFGQITLSMLSTEDANVPVDDLIPLFTDSKSWINPTADIPTNIKTIVEDMIYVGNWIYIAGVLIYAGAIIGDLWTMDFGEAVKRAIYILFSILILTAIVSAFQIAGYKVINPADSLGQTITDLWNWISGGTATSLDVSAESSEGWSPYSFMLSTNNTFTARSVVNGIFSIMPLIVPSVSLGLAIFFRKRDLGTILFAKNIRNTAIIKIHKVKRGSIMPFLFMGIFATYYIGYMLINSSALQNDLALNLSFLIGSLVVFIALAQRWLIINQSFSLWNIIKNIFIWSIAGLSILFLYFQIVQPMTYYMGWRDTPNDMYMMSQNGSILESDTFKQMFLVAAPETLLFQVFWIGAFNRVYFHLKNRKGKLAKRFRTESQVEMARLDAEKQRLFLKALSTNTQKRRINYSVELVLINEEKERLQKEIGEGVVAEVPVSFFILPNIIWWLIPSFVFSYYHSFRRGFNLQQWFQSSKGVAFWGAGILLCFIAFFSLYASILVHFLNNMINIIWSGG